jgi:predicted DNA-binding protein with PD1-like motif
MEAKLLHDQSGLRTFAIVFQKEDEVRKALLEFASTNGFADAHLTAIGAFSEVTLGFFDRQRKTYIRIPINEQVEVLSFTGNIVRNDGRPSLHAHVVVGKADGTAHWRPLSWRKSMADAGNDFVRDARPFVARA